MALNKIIISLFVLLVTGSTTFASEKPKMEFADDLYDDDSMLSDNEPKFHCELWSASYTSTWT